MSSKRFSREIVKAAGLGLGAVGLLGGLAVGSALVLEKVEQQVAQGLQQAAYPSLRPVMIGRAQPLEQPEDQIGQTARDYIVPGGVLLADIGAAAYSLWYFREKKQWQPAQTSAVETVVDAFRLTPQEEQAFEMIVARYHQDD